MKLKGKVLHMANKLAELTTQNTKVNFKVLSTLLDETFWNKKILKEISASAIFDALDNVASDISEFTDIELTEFQKRSEQLALTMLKYFEFASNGWADNLMGLVNNRFILFRDMVLTPLGTINDPDVVESDIVLELQNHLEHYHSLQGEEYFPY